MSRHLFKKLAGLFAVSHDVLLYAYDWGDEVWVRTTAFACARAGMRVAVATRGAAPDWCAEIVASYRAARIPAYFGVAAADLAALRAGAVVTATSGMDRSPFHPRIGKLVHMPHSIVSLHMVYPRHTFDAFDVLFAAGPHHAAEFAALGRANARAERPAIAVGYGKLDILRDRQESRPIATPAAQSHILLAPSWGPDNLLKRFGPELVTALLRAGYRVTLRAHPMFHAQNDPVLTASAKAGAYSGDFALEASTGGDDAIFDADLLVTDYSGIAFEFAALRERPVVFVDVAPKIVNADWAAIGRDPIEISARAKIGRIAPPDIATIIRTIGESLADTGRTIDRSEFLYDTRRCADAACDALKGLLAANG